VKRLATYMVGWRGYFGFCEPPEVLIGLTRWVRLRLRCALWRQWKTPRRRRAALLQLGVRTLWPLIRLVVGAVPGTWPAPKLSPWELQMLTSGRSAFLHCSRTTSSTSRPAVYGPVRTVVWQGSAGDCRPYADLTGYSDKWMLGWLGKVRRPSRVLHDRATTQPELASVPILVRTGHIRQKGGTPSAQHHEEFRPEPVYVPQAGNRRVR
jgi:Group II intron, maturase-specific domain